MTFSDNGKDELQLTNDQVELVFVCDPFEGEDFEALRREEQRILGPPIVISCAKLQQPLPCNSRPLFCSVMMNHIICFTGFRKKEQLGKFCNLVHNMGGSIRREFSGRVTQLVASSVQGQKYRVLNPSNTCMHGLCLLYICILGSLYWSVRPGNH